MEAALGSRFAFIIANGAPIKRSVSRWTTF
jgi:hypothetical protein